MMSDHSGSASRQNEHYLDAAAGGAAPPHFAAPESPTARPPGTKAASSGAEAPEDERATPYSLRDFREDSNASDPAALDKIRDVELDLTIELGRAEMLLEDVVKLEPGMVVPLDKRAGDPVDVVVNGRLVARGEVVIVDNNFCVRVVELVAAADAA